MDSILPDSHGEFFIEIVDVVLQGKQLLLEVFTLVHQTERAN